MIFVWNATACCSIRHCSARRVASLVSGCWRWSSRRFSSPAARFNLGSPRQLGEILFDRRSCPYEENATGQPSTDEEVLQELAADYPLPSSCSNTGCCRNSNRPIPTSWPSDQCGDRPRTHELRASDGSDGRLASTDPNLQNIPVRTVEGRRIREAFIASPGHVLVSAAYSQSSCGSWRICPETHRWRERSPKERAFTGDSGRDLRRADGRCHARPATVHQGVNFGLIYGMSAFGLAAQLNIERGAAQQFIDKYFARYPGVAEYMLRTRELARKQGYVKTVFGRRLWLPDINAGGGPRRQAAERAAINAPMQGTAADLIKLAMIEVQAWLDRERLNSRLILQVHDELVLEVPNAEVPRLKVELPRLMTGVASLDVPWSSTSDRTQLGAGALAPNDVKGSLSYTQCSTHSTRADRSWLRRPVRKLVARPMGTHGSLRRALSSAVDSCAYSGSCRSLSFAPDAHP